MIKSEMGKVRIEGEKQAVCMETELLIRSLRDVLGEELLEQCIENSKMPEEERMNKIMNKIMGFDKVHDAKDEEDKKDKDDTVGEFELDKKAAEKLAKILADMFREDEE